MLPNSLRSVLSRCARTCEQLWYASTEELSSSEKKWNYLKICCVNHFLVLLSLVEGTFSPGVPGYKLNE